MQKFETSEFKAKISAILESNNLFHKLFNLKTKFGYKYTYEVNLRKDVLLRVNITTIDLCFGTEVLSDLLNKLEILEFSFKYYLNEEYLESYIWTQKEGSNYKFV